MRRVLTHVVVCVSGKLIQDAYHRVYKPTDPDLHHLPIRMLYTTDQDEDHDQDNTNTAGRGRPIANRERNRAPALPPGGMMQNPNSFKTGNRKNQANVLE